ncbi:hypothetical protein DFH09DRAFT_1076228 [Mycena vulgaris]|nr:hypothetical protein DFH09DRAFT_1076228 [Mycena vulgaris]
MTPALLKHQRYIARFAGVISETGPPNRVIQQLYRLPSLPLREYVSRLCRPYRRNQTSKFVPDIPTVPPPHRVRQSHTGVAAQICMGCVRLSAMTPPASLRWHNEGNFLDTFSTGSTFPGFSFCTVQLIRIWVKESSIWTGIHTPRSFRHRNKLALRVAVSVQNPQFAR